MAGPSVLVKILGDSKGFDASISSVEKSTSGLGKVGNTIGNVLGSALKVVSTGFAVTAGAATAFGVSAFMSAARVGEMDATLRALSKGNADVYKNMTDTVSAIRKTGIEAGVAQGLVAQFTRNQLDLGRATDLARVAQDAAVISGQNSTETLDQLIHGITTQNSLVLRNAGVNVQAGKAMDDYAASLGKSSRELTEAERAQAVLNAVIEAGGPIAGAYSAAMEEPGKVLRSFPRIFDDIKVSVGSVLVEAFGPIILKAYELTKAISDALKPGGALRDVIIAIGDKLKAAIGPLTRFIDKAKEWVTSIKPDQVEGIADKIKSIGPAAGAAGTALGLMGGANIPIIGKLVGAINPVAGALAALVLGTEGGRSALMDLVGAVKPLISQLLSALMPALNSLFKSLGPLIGALGEVASVLIGAVLKAITPILPAIVQLAGILAGALASGLKALTPALTMLGDLLGKVMTVIAPLLPAVGQLVAAILDLAIKAITPLLPPIIDLLEAALIPLLPVIVELVGPITQLVVAISPLITLVANLLGAILGLMGKAIAPLIQILATLLGFLVGGLANAMVSAVNSVNSFGRAVMALVGAVTGALGSIISWFGNLGSTILRTLSAFPSLLISAGRSLIEGLINGVTGMLGAINNVLGGIPGRVISAIGDTGRMLFDAGARIIQGLIDGVTSKIGAIGDAIGGVASKIKGFLPFSPAREGPFAGRGDPKYSGQAIIGGIISGMESRRGALEREMASLTSDVSLGAPALAMAGAGGSGAGGTPITAGPRGPAVVIQHAEFNDEADIELFMRRAAWAVSTGAV